jgi:predicted transcriptional regulator
MSKFLFTGVLLAVLGSFLYLPLSSEDTEKTSKPGVTITPLKDQIRFKREEKSIPIADLAKQVGCPSATIEKIEKGETVPSRELLVKIQEALNAEFILDGY